MDEVAVMAAVMEEVVIGLIDHFSTPTRLENHFSTPTRLENHFSVPKSALHFTLIPLFIVCAQKTSACDYLLRFA